MQVSERQTVATGDIILLYKTHPAKNAELTMAFVVSLASEGLQKHRIWVWNHTMTHTHNNLLDLWDLVNTCSATDLPRACLAVPNLDKTPIKIPVMPDNQAGYIYFNHLLNSVQEEEPRRQPAAPSSATAAVLQKAPVSAVAAAVQQKAPMPAAAAVRTQSNDSRPNTFTFGAPAVEETAAKKPRIQE
jgi:hypothetical protein